MKIKTILLLILALTTFSVSAQNESGIKGRVVSRTTRKPVEGVKVTLMPGRVVTTTSADGIFFFGSLDKGEYTLTLEAQDFEPLQLVIGVKSMREMNLVLVPESGDNTTLDDAVFSELDTENGNDAQALPSSLSASRDVFNNIASYKFSEMRFNTRGYDSQYSDVYMNGIRLNDAMTGYTPWSLWGGLNDATRNQEIASGLTMGDYGLGGIGGLTNINTRPSQIRKGFRAGFVTANSMYRYRGMLTYASGKQDNGWSYAVSVSTRQGGNDYVHGVYYNAFGYFLAVEKEFNPQHRLSLMLLGAPTERGVLQASTQEAYDLVGNNYYNPNWGWLNGKRVNSRVRNFHEPLALLNYTYDFDEHSQLNIATSLRFGKNGYSALTWYGGPDPRPDYYRNLPGYYEGTYVGANLYEAWMANTDNIRHINWEKLYNINRMQSAVPGYTGSRSINMVEERHADQLDWNLSAQFSHLFLNNSKLSGGVNLRRNRTEYYSQVKDLLGGDYWIDVDKFAERDMGGLDPVLYQNDMDYYRQNGKARAVRVGDKYGYDYYGNIVDGRGWLQYGTRVGALSMNFGAELGHAALWRHGLWQKGLFLDNSKGDSETQNYLTHKLKANFSYSIDSRHRIDLNVAHLQEAPVFQSAFVSPRTRNSATPGISTEKVFSADASYNLRVGDVKARATFYYTEIKDQSKVISYYDDVETTFSNFAMSGINSRHFGLEAAATIPLFAGISLNGAVSWGQYTYTNNPDFIQIQDNSGIVKNQGKVYWKNFRVESTPQLAANIGLSYRGPKNIFASIDVNHYNNTYISMSPLYRTDAVFTPGMTQEQILALRHQEKFDEAFVLNAGIGKNWYIMRKYTLGFSLEAKNLLNNQNIKTGGYEQVRLLKNTEEAYQRYEPFGSKYFYMFGATYYMNIYFRF